MEENSFDRIARPEFLRQCLHGHCSSGQSQAILLQRKLQSVQEDARAEEEGITKGIRKAGKEAQGAQAKRTKQQTGH